MTSTAESAPAAGTAEARPVSMVTADGERLEFPCAPGQSVLEAAAAAGAAGCVVVAPAALAPALGAVAG